MTITFFNMSFIHLFFLFKDTIINWVISFFAIVAEMFKYSIEG